jgi:hypothetical protein
MWSTPGAEAEGLWKRFRKASLRQEENKEGVATHTGPTGLSYPSSTVVGFTMSHLRLWKAVEVGHVEVEDPGWEKI